MRWAGDFLRRDCCDAREVLRADFAQGGVLRLASKTLVQALDKLSAQVPNLLLLLRSIVCGARVMLQASRPCFSGLDPGRQTGLTGTKRQPLALHQAAVHGFFRLWLNG